MNTLIVFSLDKPGQVAGPADVNSAMALLASAGLQPKQGIGFYQGEMERCYMVPTDDAGLVALIKSIAMQFKQESILSVELDTRVAKLHYLATHEQEYVGLWTKTERLTKNMTVDLETMEKFITIKS